jgi:hypothetical protein
VVTTDTQLPAVTDYGSLGLHLMRLLAAAGGVDLRRDTEADATVVDRELAQLLAEPYSQADGPLGQPGESQAQHAQRCAMRAALLVAGVLRARRAHAARAAE